MSRQFLSSATTAISQRWVIASKWLAVLLSYGFVYYRLQQGNLWQEVSQLLTGPPLVLLAVLALMPLNWGFEAGKWQHLMRPFYRSTWFQSWQAIWGSLPVSMITPQRLGEIPARALFVPPKYRRQALAGNVMGSLSQTLATQMAGSLGLLFLLTQGFSLPVPLRGLLVIAGGIYTGLTLWLFLFTSHALQLLAHWPIFRSLIKRIPTEALYHQRRGRIFLFSLVRYSIFLLQYHLLLLYFQVPLPSLTAIAAIAGIYLILSVVPSFLLAELGIRSSVALLILGHFSSHSAGIVAASSALWLINLALPALAGSYILLKAKISTGRNWR